MPEVKCEKCGKIFYQMNYRMKYCTKCWDKVCKKANRYLKRHTFIDNIKMYLKRKNRGK